jgi:hypothetical protein
MVYNVRSLYTGNSGFSRYYREFQVMRRASDTTWRRDSVQSMRLNW